MALLQEQLIFGGVLLLMLCSEGPVAVVWQLKPEHGCEIRLCSHMVVAGCEILSGSGSDSTGPRTAGPEWGKKKGDVLVLEGPLLTAHGLILHGWCGDKPQAGVPVSFC